LPGGLTLRMQPRANTGRDGYDSYVFPCDPNSPLWLDIPGEHLKMFNGGFGGVMVSDHDMLINRPALTLAKSGNDLKNAALCAAPAGNGMLLISRIQTRGRLCAIADASGLYAPRVDPVAQQYVLNLLTTAMQARICVQLDPQRVVASSGSDGPLAAALAVDGDPGTRWSSDSSDPQWIALDLGRVRCERRCLNWETAFGKAYEILLSRDGRQWQTMFGRKTDRVAWRKSASPPCPRVISVCSAPNAVLTGVTRFGSLRRVWRTANESLGAIRKGGGREAGRLPAL
jgi:hypothetical protein